MFLFWSNWTYLRQPVGDPVPKFPPWVRASRCHWYYLVSSNWLQKSSHRRCSIKKAVLKNFAIFTEKHLCWSLFLIKLQARSPATLFKRDSNTGVFLWILRNGCKWLFLSTLQVKNLSNSHMETWSSSSEETLQKIVLKILDFHGFIHGEVKFKVDWMIIY